MGILEYDINRDSGRRDEISEHGDRVRGDRKHGDRDQGNGGKGQKDQKETKKEPIGKREPVRLAGAVVSLITIGALVLFGWEVTADQEKMLNDFLLLIIPVIVPVIAGFEVARSKVDSPATVKRKLREKDQS